MTGRVVDLDLRRALRRDVERLAAEGPEMVRDAARERCAEWLANEPPDSADERAERSTAAARKPPLEA